MLDLFVFNLVIYSICTTFDFVEGYFRSRKLKYYLVFFSLIRTFAAEKEVCIYINKVYERF